MYQPLFDRLALDSTADAGVTSYLDLGGFRAVQVDVVVMSIQGDTAPSVAWSVELSGDGENWTAAVGLPQSIIGVGYRLGPAFPGLSATKVRIKFFLATTATSAVMSAGVNFSNV